MSSSTPDEDRTVITPRDKLPDAPSASAAPPAADLEFDIGGDAATDFDPSAAGSGTIPATEILPPDKAPDANRGAGAIPATLVVPPPAAAGPALERTEIVPSPEGRPVGPAATAMPNMAPTMAAGAPPAPATQGAASSAGDSGNALPIGTYLGEFELTGLIGEGGFGIVYLAWDHSLQRKVALKEYMPSALAARESTGVQVRSERYRETFDAGLKSFVNEARLLAQFDHPSLVKVYRFWEANGTAYMVMPLYEGTTLKDKLRALGKPPEEAWLLSILGPLTEALAVIHAESCFHRDIAPDNVILLAASGRPLLLDFGAARRVIGDMTQALTVILKPGYAPVEQYAEAPHMKQGPWTDVYALAASIHFAIIGRTPPPSVGRLMGDSFVPLSQSAAGRYSTRFLAAIDKALAVRPEQRTQTITELRLDLGLGEIGDTPQSSSITRIEPPPPAAPPPAPVPAPPALQTPRQTTEEANAPTIIPQAPAPQPSAPVPQPAPRPAAPQARPGPNKAMIGAIAAGVLVAGGVGGWLALGGKKTEAPPPVAAPAPAPATQPAPVPAPPPVAVAPKPQGFDVGAEFDKVVESQSGGYKVGVAASKTRLSIKANDTLQMSVTSNLAGYIHVLYLDAEGLYQMFPNGDFANTAIKAGQTFKLPAVPVSDPTGTADILVFVSKQPRDYSEISKERANSMLKLPIRQAGAEALAKWTRSTPLLLGALRGGCPSSDCEDYGAMRLQVEVVR